MAKFGRMMAPSNCDFIQVVNDVGQKDQGIQFIIMYIIINVKITEFHLRMG